MKITLNSKKTSPTPSSCLNSSFFLKNNSLPWVTHVLIIISFNYHLTEDKYSQIWNILKFLLISFLLIPGVSDTERVLIKLALWKYMFYNFQDINENVSVC